jgi:hypothetical protein
MMGHNFRYNRSKAQEMDQVLMLGEASNDHVFIPLIMRLLTSEVIFATSQKSAEIEMVVRFSVAGT